MINNTKLPIILIGNNFKYEVESVTKLFIPAERFDFTRTADEIPQFDEYISAETLEKENGVSLKVTVKYKGQFRENYGFIHNAVIEKKSLCEHELCRLISHSLSDITGITAPWGLMTGIRPVKKVIELLADGLSEIEAKKVLTEKYEITPSKLNLAFETAKNQIPIVEKIDKNAVSLYVSIPFCPTRCSYCSFVSHSMDSAIKLMPDYISCLCKEIEITAKIVKKYGVKIDTIYFGGGTPTSISADDIKTVMQTVADNFDISNVREYNYEAGRADTITEEKLRIIKEYGADRISINPQTFNDDVLKVIGRKHTGADTIKAFEIARKIGFKNINTDLIAGLPTESAESFKKSLDTAISLDPESITVHTLTIKRSASLFQNGKEYIKNHVEEMVDYSIDKLMKYGYNPYYLYRQKNTLDNLENVGYAKKGFESYYNIYIMDETQTILGVGCASSTKLVTSDGRISRVHNYKFPYEYIGRFDTLMQKKGEVEECLKKISSSKQ